MSNGAVIAAAIANAIKASGVLVRVESHHFQSIIQRSERPLVVMVKPGFLFRKYRYLSSYKGLAFFTKSDQPLNLPGDAELVTCREISMPS